MDKHVMTATLLGLAMAMSPMVAATGAELKVLAGGSMTASLKELGPKFEAATGHKLDMTFAATPELIKMSTSAPFDLGVVPVDVMKNDDATGEIRGHAGQYRARRLRGRGEGRRTETRCGHARGAEGGAAQGAIDCRVPDERGRRLRAEDVRAARHRGADQGQG